MLSGGEFHFSFPGREGDVELRSGAELQAYIPGVCPLSRSPADTADGSAKASPGANRRDLSNGRSPWIRVCVGRETRCSLTLCANMTGLRDTQGPGKTLFWGVCEGVSEDISIQ